MIPLPPGLQAASSAQVTTLCTVWIVRRRDGQVTGFTDHDRMLVVDGVACRPETGFSASEAESALGLGIDTMQVDGALSDDGIAEADLAGGLFDGAVVETWRVDWTDAAAAAVRIRNQSVSHVEALDGAFRVELESRSAAHAVARGRRYNRTCDAELGDQRCGVDLADSRYQRGVTVIEVAPGGALVVAGLDDTDPGWGSGGRLAWSTGPLAGKTTRITLQRRDGLGRNIVLLASNDKPSVGDVALLTVGCDRAFSTCRRKFGNAENFRGFPHMPGTDAGYAYAAPGSAFDGSPIVP